MYTYTYAHREYVRQKRDENVFIIEYFHATHFNLLLLNLAVKYIF